LGNYCGGTWKGMESRLDYISGLGFDAIWITPIVTSKFFVMEINIHRFCPDIG
jgi:glycosidase